MQECDGTERSASNQHQRSARAVVHLGLQPVGGELVVVHGDGSGLRGCHCRESVEGVVCVTTVVIMVTAQSWRQESVAYAVGENGRIG